MKLPSNFKKPSYTSVKNKAPLLQYNPNHQIVTEPSFVTQLQNCCQIP